MSRYCVEEFKRLSQLQFPNTSNLEIIKDKILSYNP